MKRVCKNIEDSLINNGEGYSARKLSALIAISVAVYATIHYAEPQYLVHIICVWLAFALICLGIVTIEQIIRLREKKETELEEK